MPVPEGSGTTPDLVVHSTLPTRLTSNFPDFSD
jgi:hypothetical protein